MKNCVVCDICSCLVLIISHYLNGLPHGPDHSLFCVGLGEEEADDTLTKRELVEVSFTSVLQLVMHCIVIFGITDFSYTVGDSQ